MCSVLLTRPFPGGLVVVDSALGETHTSALTASMCSMRETVSNSVVVLYRVCLLLTVKRTIKGQRAFLPSLQCVFSQLLGLLLLTSSRFH